MFLVVAFAVVGDFSKVDYVKKRVVLIGSTFTILSGFN